MQRTINYALFTLLLLSAPVHADSRCNNPISYTIKTVDSEFGFSRNSIRSAVAAAAKIWEFGTGRRRFYESEKGDLTIHVRYTERQDIVQAIKILEAEGKLVHEFVDAFNARQTGLNKDIEQFNKRSEAYEKEVSKHNAEIQDYNNRGRFSPTYMQHLKRQGLLLRQRAQSLDYERTQLDKRIAQAEGDRRTTNQQVTDFHTDKVQLDAILARMPDYERLGEYRQDQDARSITIYVIRNKKQLTLLLAHEFGHALGIGHVDDPAALMYSRETMDNTHLRVLHSADLQAFRRLCGNTGQKPTGNYF